VIEIDEVVFSPDGDGGMAAETVTVVGIEHQAMGDALEGHGFAMTSDETARSWQA
jgi:hypothetical protein